MVCKVCEKEFEPARYHYHQKFCSAECRRKYRSQKPFRQLMAQLAFEREWVAWKRDFALQKHSGGGGKFYEGNCS